MITKSIKDRIKEYFLENPTAKLRIRQIERTLKAPLPSVIRYVKELEKEEILENSEIAGIKLFLAARSSEKYKLEKKCYNTKRIFNSGLIEYLKNEFSNPTITLFGSYAKAEDIEKSDIDLYIETPKIEKINLEKFEKILNKKIQIFNYTNIKKIENKELANNIINGILLNGFLEVF
jgi:predicted nucleotidyltransferase